MGVSVREELVQIIPTDLGELRAELTALVKGNGTIRLHGGGLVGLSLQFETGAVARKVVHLLKKSSGITSSVGVKRRIQLSKNNIYGLEIEPDQTRRLLDDLGLGGGQFLRGVPELVRSSSRLGRAYLRGAFLGKGSVSFGHYHLEIRCEDPLYTQELTQLMGGLGLSPKTGASRGGSRAYLKSAEEIATFLRLVGAHRALLSMEDTRILRGMKSDVNRLVNAETANLDKALEAAFQQMQVIRFLDDALGLENLPLRLREVARVRLESPESNLSEIGQLLDPPVGKSGVRHRFDRLAQMARDLGYSEDSSGTN